MKLSKLLLVVMAIISFAVTCFGQSEPNLEIGFKPYGSYQGSEIDTVGLMNGNLTLHIPFPFSYPQRGGRLDDKFLTVMNSKTWSIQQLPDPAGLPPTYGWAFAKWWTPGTAASGETLVVTVTRTYEHDTTTDGNTSFMAYGYSVTTWDGAQHPLMDVSGGAGTAFEATDASGWHVNATAPDANGIPQAGLVLDRNGNQYPISMFGGMCHTTNNNNLNGHTSTTICNQFSQIHSVTDANGNVYTFMQNGIPGTDTMGRPDTFFTGGGVPPLSAADPRCVSSLPLAGSFTETYPSPGGVNNTLTLCYATLSLQTSFGVSGNYEFPNGSSSTTTVGVLVTMILPDGNKWTFNYDSYGNVTSIGLPLGGTITYQWATVPLPAFSSANPVSRAVTSRTVTDGRGNSSIWNYHWMTQQTNPTGINGTYTNVVTDPLGNDMAHVFTNLGGLGSFYETSAINYQGSSASASLLKRIDTTYQVNTVGGGSQNDSVTVLPITIQTTVYPSGKVSLVQKTYDALLTDPVSGTTSYGKELTQKEYDWGPSGPGALLRETDYTYLWHNNSQYLTAHMLDLTASVVTKDGSGNRVAETDYAYDETAPTGYEANVGALPLGTHLTTAPNGAVRGNATTVSKWLNTSNSFISSRSTWYDTGEASQQIDPLNNATTHYYDPAYAGAYSTMTCNAKSQCVSGTYDFTTGLLTSFTNANATTQASGNTPGDGAHTSNYTYDFMSRMTSAQAPPDAANGNARAQHTFTFSAPNTSPFSVQTQKSVTNSLTDTATAYFDGLGRTYQRQHLTPSGTISVNTTFDGLGHSVKVTNPFYTPTDPTYGETQSQYDALGRVAQVTKQDGSISTVVYTDNCTVATDEGGKQRKACSDALGRLIEVDEPNPGAAASTATGTVTLSGTEQSANSQPAASGSGTVTIGGTEQSAQSCFHNHCTTIWDTGTATVIVNGLSKSISYGQSDTSSTVASNLAAAFNGDGSSPVNASASGSVLTLTAKVTGSATNYSLSSSSATSDNACNNFCGPSFIPSNGSSLTGGQNSSSTPDTGTITATINGIAYTVSYGTGDTPSSIAARLATAVSAGAYANASASGGTMNLTSKMAGTSGNYSLAASYTWNTGTFTQPSFTTSASAGLTGGINASELNNNPFVTLYQYDTLGNLLCVEQHGGVSGTGCSAPPDGDAASPWRVRRFGYDSLSRLTSSSNPETNTAISTATGLPIRVSTTYAYDANGNRRQKTSLAPNQRYSATQTISYCYDVLNRVTGRAYSAQACMSGQLPVGTAAVSYAYDQGTNGVGHLIAVTDQAGSGSYSFDVLGRMTNDQRTIGGVTTTTSYTYNLNGSVRSLTYPGPNFVVSYAYDSAARMTSVADSTGFTYVSTQPADFLPTGAMQKFETPSFNYQFTLNNRLQPTEIIAGSSTLTLFDKKYIYTPSGMLANNGDVLAVTNLKDGTRSQQFAYDALNRLLSAGDNGHWSNTYTYDAWGNLVHKAQGSPAGEGLTSSADNANHLTGYNYDAAGNMTSNAGDTYSYDPEGRITGFGGYSYLYDDGGNRVEKTNGTTVTRYWYASQGIIAESDANGNFTSYIFFAGQRLARNVSGDIKYYVTDHLHSTAIFADKNGTILDDNDFYPWGGLVPGVGTTSSTNHYKFTGKERDSDSGLDFFGARYNSSALGRFITPDDGTDQHPDNPQSWNLYGYCGNNPLNLTDPTGHSTHTALNGDVLAVYDDGDLGVYLHADIDNFADWDGDKLDWNDPGSYYMGKTQRWGEFANFDSRHPLGIDGSHVKGAFIHFGVPIDAVIRILNNLSKSLGLEETAALSQHGQLFDIKTGALADHGIDTGYLLNGDYVTIRSAGNYLAGLNAMTATKSDSSHISPEFAQKLFGAYQQDGKRGLAYTLTTGRNYPGTSPPYWGEEPYSGFMQQEGINAGSHK